MRNLMAIERQNKSPTNLQDCSTCFVEVLGERKTCTLIAQQKQLSYFYDLIV